MVIKLKEIIDRLGKEEDEYVLFHLRTTMKIDELLRAKINEELKNEVSADKIIGDSFGKTIVLAYALGILSQQTYESLLRFKAIRNMLAHHEQPKILEYKPEELVKFLGKNAREKVTRHGSSYPHWYKNAVELLLEQVVNEVKA